MRTKNARKNRTPKARESLKGQWGHTGAPPKNIHWPKGMFTFGRLFAMNVDKTGRDPKKSCELTLRTKVADGLINLPDGTTNATGTVYQLVSKKQPHGKVGRPIDIFVLKGNFNQATMALKAKKVDVQKAKQYIAKVDVAPTPTVAPPVAQLVPVVNNTAPANPAPMRTVEFTKGGIRFVPTGPKIG